MSNLHEHVMISRAELAQTLMKLKGFDPEKFELIDMDIRSTALQRILPLYTGPWSDTECPFDLLTFGVKTKEKEKE